MKLSRIRNSNSAPPPFALKVDGASAEGSARTTAYRVIPSHRAGFTFDPQLNQGLASGRNTNPGICVVSIFGHELKVPGIPPYADLYRWIEARPEYLRPQGCCVEGWPSLVDHCLDLLVLIRGRAKAMKFGWANQQQANCPPASGESLEISHPADSGDLLNPGSAV